MERADNTEPALFLPPVIIGFALCMFAVIIYFTNSAPKPENSITVDATIVG